MDIPESLVTAVSGFYEDAVELDGLAFDEMIDIGVPVVVQSRCPELLDYLDRLLLESDEVVYAVWKRASSNYLFRDIEVARKVFLKIRARVAERVESGGGGMPGRGDAPRFRRRTTAHCGRLDAAVEEDAGRLEPLCSGVWDQRCSHTA